MTYEEAKKQVAEYQDPMFGTRLRAVHRQPGDGGTEDCLILVPAFRRGLYQPAEIDCWYMHSCGYERWIQLGCIERKLPKEGDSVLILGANGKSGVLCGFEAMKKVGPNGKVVGVVRNPKQVPDLMELGVYTDVIVADCTKPVEVMEAALAVNGGKEYDLSISCVNIESCEMSAILPVRDDGKVYFFSMATSFTKAALGAEGIGKDVEMIVGNGYTKNHANITLDVLRESEKLRNLFEAKYV